MANYEFWATLAAILVAAVTVILFFRSIKDEIKSEMRKDTQDLRGDIRELRTSVATLADRLASLGERVARLEGLLSKSHEQSGKADVPPPTRQ